MESEKKIKYSLLSDVENVNDFLCFAFNCSKSKVKKYFQKSFLNKSFKKRMAIDLPINFVNDLIINPKYEGEAVEVIYEDDDFLVFSKNPNQFIHPLTYDESNNCLSYLRSVRNDRLLDVNTSSYDRGLLYRLDYETSGVCIYVKKEEDYRYLRDNFSSIAKEKIYLCWVDGIVQQDEVTLLNSFSSKGEKGKFVVVGHLNDYETSGELSFKVIKRDNESNKSLLQVTLVHGLRHQIRAQLAYYGNPICGDLMYGGKSAKRLYLHAYKYQISYRGKDSIFISEPIDFNGL